MIDNKIYVFVNHEKNYLKGFLDFNFVMKEKNKNITKEYLEQMKERNKKYITDALKNDMLYKDNTIDDIELVYLKEKGKFIKGEYYAHEYDKYSSAKGRYLLYSNGFVEYEIKCLNKNLSVLDGIWQEYNNNGCGDMFEPNEKGMIYDRS